jgi:soluble lytic murein transglycosylase
MAAVLARRLRRRRPPARSAPCRGRSRPPAAGSHVAECRAAPDARRLRALEAAFAPPMPARSRSTGAADSAAIPCCPGCRRRSAPAAAHRDAAACHPLLQASGEAAPARWLRRPGSAELARREDWTAFAPTIAPATIPRLRCADPARAARRPRSPPWTAGATSVYLTGKSLPARCDGVLARMTLGALDPDLRWQRIRLAIAEGEPGVVRSVAPGLPAGEARAGARLRRLPRVADGDAARRLARTERGRLVVASGLSRLARKDPDRAQALLRRCRAPGSTRPRGKVAYDIALWTVASYLPSAAQRLAAVPASAYDDKLHEWQVREAIARGDDAGALAAIERMGAEAAPGLALAVLRGPPARALGQARTRARAVRPGRAQAGFHGWLAADRLQLPYTLCPLEPRTDAPLRARVERDAGAGARARPVRARPSSRPRANGATRQGAWTTTRAASPYSARSPPAGSIAPCSAWPRARTTRATTRCASRCTMPTRSAATPPRSARPGLGRGADALGKQLHAAARSGADARG